MKKTLIVAGLLGLMASVPVMADAPKPAKLMVCAGCHTATGKAILPNYPNIGGQNPEYFTLAVNAYKNGERTGTNANLMKAFANMLSDDEIKEFAAYFATQNNK